MKKFAVTGFIGVIGACGLALVGCSADVQPSDGVPATENVGHVGQATATDSAVELLVARLQVYAYGFSDPLTGNYSNAADLKNYVQQALTHDGWTYPMHRDETTPLIVRYTVNGKTTNQWAAATATDSLARAMQAAVGDDGTRISNCSSPTDGTMVWVSCKYGEIFMDPTIKTASGSSLGRSAGNSVAANFVNSDGSNGLATTGYSFPCQGVVLGWGSAQNSTCFCNDMGTSGSISGGTLSSDTRYVAGTVIFDGTNAWCG